MGRGDDKLAVQKLNDILEFVGMTSPAFRDILKRPEMSITLASTTITTMRAFSAFLLMVLT